MERRLRSMDRGVVEHAITRLREGFAHAMPLKPPDARARVRSCPHCQREVDWGLSKCPHCRRLFRL